MIKQLFFILLLSACCVELMAQGASPTWKEIQQNRDKYIYGVGSAATIDKASRMALDELVSSISTQVSSQFEYRMTQTGLNADMNAQTDVRQLVSTYSRMSLRGARQLVISTSKDKERTVVRYITQNDLYEMFKQRGEKVKGYVISGIRAEKKCQVGTALQNYFWALALLNSYPDGDKLMMPDEQYENKFLYIWIPELMKNALKKINVTVNSIEKEDDQKVLTLSVTYNGTPAADLSFKCTDGEYSTDIITIKDGNGIVELPLSVNDKKLSLDIDYRGLDEANRDAELVDVIDAVSGVTFKDAVVSLGRDIRKKQQTTFAQPTLAVAEIKAMEGPATAAVSTSSSKTETMVKYLDAKEAAAYLPVAQQIEKALRSRYYHLLEPLCTAEGWDAVQKLLKYGDARLVGYPNIQFLDNNGDVTIRSFPMSFTFKSNNHRKFMEDVVFHLNKDGKITQVAFGLEKRAADDILCHRGNWSDRSKQTIVNFMETYKTAFALKDLEYIDRIFSDDALIITGRVVKSSGRQSELQPNDLSRVKYIKQTKAEYLKNLERSFGSNEYINLKFADTTVKKGGFINRQTGKPKEVYGIQLKQDYFSATYGDTGYLFLAVDLDNPDQPVIHIRTWQPEADVAGSSVFGIEDFN